MNNKKNPWWLPSLVLFFRLSGWIAIPVVISLYLGKWLDKHFDTAPWLFVLVVGLAFIITLIGLIKETRQATKEIKKQEREKENYSSGNHGA